VLRDTINYTHQIIETYLIRFLNVLKLPYVCVVYAICIIYYICYILYTVHYYKAYYI